MSTEKSSNTTPKTSVDPDAAFRQFFNRLSQADIEKLNGTNPTTQVNPSNTTTTTPTKSSPSSSPSHSRDTLACECYLQLYSSIPQVHAHHLEALQEWIQLNVLNSRTLSMKDIHLPTPINSPLRPTDTLFRLTPELLNAIRTLAKIPPAHSRLTDNSLSSSAMKTVATASPTSASNDDIISEPTFAEALAVEKGRAAIPTSKLRSDTHSNPTTSNAVEISVTTPAPTLDSRMHAAASLYALLTVHTSALILSSSSGSNASPLTAFNFLHSIPLDLELDARRRVEEERRHHHEAPVFDVPELAPEEEILVTADDDDGSDDGFDADPLPPDSDDDSSAPSSHWGNLDGIPVDPRDLERELARSSSHPAFQPTWSSVQQRLLQLISLWDSELCTFGSVFEDIKLDQHLLSLWRSASRHRCMFSPALDGGSSLNQLRQQILVIFRAQMMKHPASITKHLHACVQELLGLPQCIPGLGSNTNESTLEESNSEGCDDSFRERFDASQTLISLLAQLCQSTTSHPLTLGGALVPTNILHATDPSAVRHLHQFLTFNLNWLSRRLRDWRRVWMELIESGRSLLFEPGLRVRVNELHALSQLFAFFIWYHPQLTSKTDEIGPTLIASGVIHHLVALVLMNQHPIFHSHPHLTHSSDASPTTSSLFCASCASYEVGRSHHDLVVQTTVDSRGDVVCSIQPYVSPFAATGSSTTSPVVDPIVLPTSTNLPNPLAITHQLLLLAATFSSQVSHLLYSHPAFFPFLKCPCYEELYMLPSMLIPVFVAFQTRELSLVTVTTPPTAPSTTTTSPSVVGTSSNPTAAAPKKKEKKSKLVVAAISEPETQSSDSPATTKAADSASNELSWNQSALTPGIIVETLKRTQSIVNQAIDQLRTPTDSSAADDTAIELLHSLLSYVYDFSCTSPARRLLVTLIGTNKLPTRDLDAARTNERELLKSFLGSLLSLRTKLPTILKRITQQLHDLTRGSKVRVEEDESKDGVVEVDSTQHSNTPDQDSVSGHVHRALKTRLEFRQSLITKMQQYLKKMSMDGAKKD